MRVEATDDPASYRAAVSGLLEADPLVNTVMLSVLSVERTGAPATYLSVHDGDELVGTALCTPPHQLLLGTMPDEAVVPVAEAFARTNADAPGVEGEAAQVVAFAARWRELTGREAEPHHGLRLFRLGTLGTADAPGAARVADPADTAGLRLATDWFEAFAAEIEQPMAREHAAASAGEKLAGGRLWWWDDAGEPMCLAGHTIPQHGFARIGPVYTPPRHRGHGYASALTADLSRRIRAGGNDVCLFTDVRNPTTNKIYTAIGYEPVGDRVRYSFR